MAHYNIKPVAKTHIKIVGLNGETVFDDDVTKYEVDQEIELANIKAGKGEPIVIDLGSVKGNNPRGA